MEELIKKFKKLTSDNSIPIITADEELQTLMYRKCTEDRYKPLNNCATSDRLINVSDGVGLINYNQLSIPCKQLDGTIVSVSSRKNLNGEEELSILKGKYIPFDLSKLEK